jgi:hypothetical protein
VYFRDDINEHSEVGNGNCQFVTNKIGNCLFIFYAPFWKKMGDWVTVKKFIYKV